MEHAYKSRLDCHLVNKIQMPLRLTQREGVQAREDQEEGEEESAKMLSPGVHSLLIVVLELLLH